MNQIETLISQLSPLGVQRIAIGDICIESTTRNHDALINEIWSVTNKEGLVRTSDYFENVRTSENTSNYKIVSQGAFVYNPSRINIGSIAFHRESHIIAVSPMYVVFEVDLDRVLPEYLMLFFESMDGKQQILDKCEVGARFRLPFKSLSKITLSVPPIAVQEEIIRILTKFSALRRELEIELEARLLQRRQVTEWLHTGKLGQLKGVSDVPLSDLVHFENGKPHETFVDPKGDWELITSKFISSNGIQARRINAINVRTKAQVDDIAIVLSDLPNGKALAKCYLIQQENYFAVNQRIAILRSKDVSIANPEYLYHYVNRNPQILKFDDGSTQTHLKKSNVLDTVVRLPPLDLQIQIAKSLSALDIFVFANSGSLPAEIQARQQQYEYYRTKLMTFKDLEIA